MGDEYTNATFTVLQNQSEEDLNLGLLGPGGQLFLAIRGTGLPVFSEDRLADPISIAALDRKG